MKKRFASLLVLPILLGFMGVPVGAASSKAELYDMYTDDMLFQQNAISKISGTATNGTEIKIELFNSKNDLVLSSSAKAKNNTFSVEFLAPEGSFEAYSLVVKANNKEIKTLKNIVFGELWVSSGQSNMHYPLGQEETVRNLKDVSEIKPSPYVRSMLMPTYDATVDPEKHYDKLPYEPQKDVKGAYWISGESPNIAGMSAVSYFFANKMLKELNVPIGVINAPLGGTPIATWLPREVIEKNELIKTTLTEHGFYIDKENWGKEEQNIYMDLTANYNLRLAPLDNFSVSGLIWYQGESDIMVHLDSEFYFEALDELQKTLSKHFGFKNSLMPIICTQLAPYFYEEGSPDLTERNISFTKFQEKSPKTRALVASYDITPTFFAEVGCIHPEPKKDIGERMGTAALGLVYNKRDSYTLPYIESAKIDGEKILVTLKNVGDGLISDTKSPLGFSICDETGVYVEAEAEIVNKNTVAVFNEYIKNPKSVAYAHGVTNETANLYSSENSNKLLPVSPFITDENYATKFWKEAAWTNCDNKTVWHNDSDLFSGYYDSWVSENATLLFEKESAFSTENGLKITSSEKEFKFKPLLTYENENKVFNFKDAETDYSKYKLMSFYVRNNGENEITLEGVNFIKNSFSVYTPQILDALDNDIKIPADNKWHKITLDLTSVNFRENECGIIYGNEKLQEIREIEFNFSSNSNADLSIDTIRFAPATTTSEKKFVADENNADTFFQKLSAKVVNAIGSLGNRN